MYEDTCRFARNPDVNVVRRNFCKQKTPSASPDRAFRPFVEAGRDAFEFCVTRHNIVDDRIQFLDFL